MSNLHRPETTEETLSLLSDYGDARIREMNLRNGASDNQFGLKMGDIRTVAKLIKTNHQLGIQLWATGNVDAMFLATMIMKPNEISEDELERMAATATFGRPKPKSDTDTEDSKPAVKLNSRTVSFAPVADWLMTNIIRQHASKEILRQRWMESSDPLLLRAGWSLTTVRINKAPEGLDPGALLDRIDHEIGTAPLHAQWTMNYCLAEIGINYEEHRERAIAIGEKYGLYRDYPVSKGCTSPFAPIWIGAIVARKV